MFQKAITVATFVVNLLLTEQVASAESQAHLVSLSLQSNMKISFDVYVRKVVHAACRRRPFGCRTSLIGNDRHV
jgi:hypothetical protein